MSDRVFSYAVVSYRSKDSNSWKHSYHLDNYINALAWIKCNKNNIIDYYISEFDVFKVSSIGELRFNKIREIDRNTINLLMAPDSTIVAKIRVAGTEYDRRRRLTDRQIAEIKAYYNHGIFSISELCDIYGVSYGTIKYHVDEDFKKSRNKLRKYYINNSQRDLAGQANYKRALILKKYRVLI